MRAIKTLGQELEITGEITKTVVSPVINLVNFLKSMFYYILVKRLCLINAIYAEVL